MFKPASKKVARRATKRSGYAAHTVGYVRTGFSLHLMTAQAGLGWAGAEAWTMLYHPNERASEKEGQDS